MLAVIEEKSVGISVLATLVRPPLNGPGSRQGTALAVPAAKLVKCLKNSIYLLINRMINCTPWNVVHFTIILILPFAPSEEG